MPSNKGILLVALLAVALWPTWWWMGQRMVDGSDDPLGALALGELCQSLETAGRAGDSLRCSALAAGLANEFAAASAEINGHLGQ